MGVMLDFEHRKNFDRSRTVRICLSDRIAKVELRAIFNNWESCYSIDWDNLEFSFRKGFEKIQFVYLVCKTNEDARKLFEDTEKIMKKWEKLEINMQSLMENVQEIILRVRDVSEAGLLVVPVSTVVSNNKKIPKKSQRNAYFIEMLKSVLKIDASKFN